MPPGARYTREDHAGERDVPRAQVALHRVKRLRRLRRVLAPKDVAGIDDHDALRVSPHARAIRSAWCAISSSADSARASSSLGGRRKT